VFLSLAAHAMLFAFLLFVSSRAKVQIVQPTSRAIFTGIQVAGGSHPSRALLPPAPSSVEARKPAKEPQPVRKLAAPTRPAPPVKPAGGTAAAATHASEGTGDAASGNGSDAQNADPAFPIFSPRPPVNNRALLPASQQEIVVDVNVNATGDVVGANLVKGMGTSLDQIVLDTVKTWRFHPAIVNGNPVASQAELIFPFNPSYPITPS